MHLHPKKSTKSTGNMADQKQPPPYSAHEGQLPPGQMPGQPLPPQNYPPPPQGYPPPPQGYTSPPHGYPPHPYGHPAQPHGQPIYNAPQPAYAQPIVQQQQSSSNVVIVDNQPESQAVVVEEKPWYLMCGNPADEKCSVIICFCSVNVAAGVKNLLKNKKQLFYYIKIWGKNERLFLICKLIFTLYFRFLYQFRNTGPKRYVFMTHSERKCNVNLRLFLLTSFISTDMKLLLDVRFFLSTSFMSTDMKLLLDVVGEKRGWNVLENKEFALKLHHLFLHLSLTLDNTYMFGISAIFSRINSLEFDAFSAGFPVISCVAKLIKTKCDYSVKKTILYIIYAIIYGFGISGTLFVIGYKTYILYGKSQLILTSICMSLIGLRWIPLQEKQQEKGISNFSNTISSLVRITTAVTLTIHFYTDAVSITYVVNDIIRYCGLQSTKERYQTNHIYNSSSDCIQEMANYIPYEFYVPFLCLFLRTKNYVHLKRSVYPEIVNECRDVKDEDRWLCTPLLKEGYRVEYIADVIVLPAAPVNIPEFLRQRRHWMVSIISNMLY
ncbi:hypothetical protein KUTeg_012021 [Tegillarca granosa]|uniref:Chitin synthase n=1 Tax=Tegillarca granosa TaxID=220873 RepID=A0ABQ9F0R5_TEGGR|nr:hypothetical protein KUTeg_012021 [Tegillarca granosa]